MAYVDASAFIPAFSSSHREHSASVTVLDGIARGSFPATTSMLSWDEIVHVLRRTEGRAEAIAVSSSFLAIPRLVLRPVDREVVVLADVLLGRYGLFPRDAIHAATAILAGERDFISGDSDFDKVREFKRIPVEKVKMK